MIPHYLLLHHDDPTHFLHFRLLTIPVLLAAVWFGRRGGLGMAFLVIASYLPTFFLLGDHAHHHALYGGSPAALAAEFGFYVLVGLLVGELTDRRVRDADELARQRDLARVGELAAMLAHDVRNPLQTITAAGGALGQPSVRARIGDPRLSHLLDVVTEEADRIESLLGDYLGLARPIDPVLCDVDAGPLVERLVSAVRVTAGGVEVALRVDASAPRLSADPALLERAVRNLLQNAVAAARHGGHGRASGGETDRPGTALQAEGRAPGTVRVEVSGRGVVIEDSGPGIAPGDREAVFAPFVGRRAGGSGLGLAIVRGIADAHGWGLAVDDSELGGARFTIAWGRAGVRGHAAAASA